MARLPVIVGMGGINAAGRSSGFHSYKRMVVDSLSRADMQSTWRDLGTRMGIIAPGQEVTDQVIDEIKLGTLVRRIETFDPKAIAVNTSIKCSKEHGGVTFSIRKAKLPKTRPQGWRYEERGDGTVAVTVDEDLALLLPSEVETSVSSGGNLPTGFNPAALYESRHHPRGIHLTVYGVSDLLGSLGFSWGELSKHIAPDEVAVYAGSAIGQIDDNSMRGIVGRRLEGGRVSSKMMAMSLTEMPADFINAYIIKSVGSTGANIGACASFLYNLRQGIADIKSGSARVVIVGASEAAVVPELIEGFRVMSALVEDHQLQEMYGLDDDESYRRACRPFSTNAGFVVGEASQFFVLTDDELALSLGANILGSVPDVFVNADGNKKSVSAPGVGNYITMAKAASLAESLVGSLGLQSTYVHAHGTGTPQNRVSESHILNEVAKAFSVEKWPVSAVKSYLGHTMAAASGDQLVSTLGAWQFGWIPGIKTIDHYAEDVSRSNLNILTEDMQIESDSDEMRAAIINSKGFGGNNASAVILSPDHTIRMLRAKHGSQAVNDYRQRHEPVHETTRSADERACAGREEIVYEYGVSVMDAMSVSITDSTIKLSEFSKAIDLPKGHQFHDYL